MWTADIFLRHNLCIVAHFNLTAEELSSSVSECYKDPIVVY